jgi:DNA end-binding protein Ku
VEFVERDDVPMGLYVKSAYYLEPEEVGVKPFYLLKRALQDTNKVAVAKVALRDREHLCLIQVQGSTLLMNTLNWPDEIRSTEELNLPEARVELSDKEVKMAQSLIENLTDHFRPEAYSDDYKVAFQQLLEQKVTGTPIEAPPPVEEPAVTDLMSALRASIEDAKRKKAAPARETVREPAARAGSKQVKVAAKSAAVKPAARRRTA